MVKGVRSKVRKNPQLHSYMHNCGVRDDDDFWFMMCVYYWMFLSDGGFDIYEMEDEMSYYDEHGLDGYGVEALSEVAVVDDIVDNAASIAEAATINEPVLEPEERGEYVAPEPVREPEPIYEAETKPSYSGSWDSDSGGSDFGGDSGGGDCGGGCD